MITIVDFGHGNLYSIGQAMRHVGADYVISSEPKAVLEADKVILPGVGAFKTAMDELRARGLVEALREVAGRGTPMLGICLGMQLLAERSAEFGDHEGLGLIPGEVIRLPNGGGGLDADRIPNVGWRTLDIAPGVEDFDAMADPIMVYFVHSFRFVTGSPADTIATTVFNDTDIAAAVSRGNVGGYQFHPENSGPVGLELLRRFAGTDHVM